MELSGRFSPSFSFGCLEPASLNTMENGIIMARTKGSLLSWILYLKMRNTHISKERTRPKVYAVYTLFWRADEIAIGWNPVENLVVYRLWIIFFLLCVLLLIFFLKCLLWLVNLEPNVTEYACNPSTQENGLGGMWVPGWFGLNRFLKEGRDGGRDTKAPRGPAIKRFLL